MEQLIGVENLEGLARLDLMRRGEVVARERVYEKHQRQLTPIADDEDAVEERVRDLVLRAAFYKRLIDPASEEDPDTAAGLQRLARWGAQTSYPVLMLALDLRHRGVLANEELARAVSLIESFLVRRQLARIPTNALNRLFVQLIRACRLTRRRLLTPCITSCPEIASTGRATRRFATLCVRSPSSTLAAATSER